MYKNKINAVYKILNTVTNDFYIGSSKNVKQRWLEHKTPSAWKQQPSNKMYQDMQKYGLDKFRFQILCLVMEEYLKQAEQELIEMLKPTYNRVNAKGWDVERLKKRQKEYEHTEKRKGYRKEYEQNEKCKGYRKKYHNQLCIYNGETLTLSALSQRFHSAGIEHPTIEAKKYLINTTN